MKAFFSILLLLFYDSCSSDPGSNSPQISADMDSVNVSTITLNQSVKFDGMLHHSNGKIYAGQGWDGSIIYEVTPSGVVTIFAQNIDGPIDMVEGDDASIYVTEWRTGNVIKIALNGVKSVFLSDPNGQPTAIVRDAAGNFYVNWVNKFTAVAALKKFDSNANLLKTYSVNIANPSGIVFDSQGNMYLAELYTSEIKKIAAGSDTAITIGKVAQFHGTHGLGKLLIKDDVMYAPDIGNHVIYRISLTGELTVLAGKTDTRGIINGNSTKARFTNPNGSLIIGNTMYVKPAYTANTRLRKISF